MSTPDFFRSRLDQMIDLKHPLAVLATRLPWASIEAALTPKLAPQAKRAVGQDLAGAFDGKFGGGISPAGRPRLPVRSMARIWMQCGINAKLLRRWIGERQRVAVARAGLHR
jgi:transposase, IS5 family